MATAYIDGDLVALRAAAANEKNTVQATHKETAEVTIFDTVTKFKEWAAANDANKDDYDLLPQKEAGAVALAIHSMKETIKRMVANCKCDNFHIVVSGKDNFRDKLPLPSKYKDNRKDAAKPLLLLECREYLIDHMGAEVAIGEADDLLVGYSYADHMAGLKGVQCSTDKDAGHGPGRLFNWTTMDAPILIEGYGSLTCTLKETTRKKADGSPAFDKIIKGTGRAFLWFQLVFGDAVDNYKPCEIAKAKFGEIGAYELLKDCTNDKEALEAIVARYKLWYPEPVTYRCWEDKLHTKTWLEIMQMYADCCFMRRWEDDRLDVEKLLKKLKIEY